MIRNWLITGVSSGFGRELTQQLLARGDRVVGTVRTMTKVAELTGQYPDTFRAEMLDVTDTAAVRDVVDRSFERLGRIDVVVSNAGYGLFGAAEELTDAQVDHLIATNLTGSIQLIRSALPHLRAQGGGRIVQMSTYGGQVAFPGNSLYHATKWGIEGFAESVAQEVAPFGIGVTIVEPGGARKASRRRPSSPPPRTSRSGDESLSGGPPRRPARTDTMTTWTEQELDRIGSATELQIASLRRNGSLRKYVTIWVVRAGQDIYIRSAYGRDNPWFVRAMASGAGRVRAGGLERDVIFERPGEDVHDAIDAAYHAKYDRYGPAIVGTVPGTDAVNTTLRVVPRA